MTMVSLTIDGRAVEIEKGAAILDAAGRLGIEIPAMCFLEGYEPSTSCMVCVVEIEGRGNLVPACGYPAEEGMAVRTDTPVVIDARRKALELLLSNHLGDCSAPCQTACPANMNIPLMLRMIGEGKPQEAVKIIKKDIALPAVLGRICPAPCEKACRRDQHDRAVSICLLKKYAADIDLLSPNPYIPVCDANPDKSAAIIGAGPAGLSAAYYLRQKGVECTVFDQNPQAGGMLRYGVDSNMLCHDILDKEIGIIFALGIDFQPETTIGKDISLEELVKKSDAVFIAAGAQQENQPLLQGFDTKNGKLSVKNRTYETSVPGIFAGGDIFRKRRLAVRSAADGKEAADSILQYLTGREIAGRIGPFNSRMGKLSADELEKMVRNASPQDRIEPSGKNSDEQRAVDESRRCLHCDCRKPDECKLRIYADLYNVTGSAYKGQKPAYEVKFDHPDIVYEAGKCIDCGLCIQTAAALKEEYGLTFIERGFEVRVETPFGRGLERALQKCAKDCVKNCPTGALAYKEKGE